MSAKAEWYLEAGVAVVWVVLPLSREVLVVTSEGRKRLGLGKKIPANRALPGLTPKVSDFFVQIRTLR